MSAVVVDASVWTSVLIEHDVNHAVSRAWRRAWMLNGGTFALPMLIVPEVAGALTRRTGDETIARRAISAILRNPAVRLKALDLDLMMRAFDHAVTFKLRGSDAVYTALAERENIPLVTWDNEQLTRAATRIQVRQPT